MKLIGLFVMCLLVLGVGASAQDAAEFQSWMKDVSATNRSLRSNLESKAGDAAAADAKKLAGIFGKVHAFFEDKSVDAAKIAMDAQNGYQLVAEHAAAGKMDEATAASDTARANCGTCHSSYREKADDGSWIIKY